MSQPESKDTMLHGSFVLIDEATKAYALRVSGLTSGSGGVPIETSIPVSARSTSITGTGEVVSPAAGGVIAQTAALEQGTWDIEIYSAVSGTTSVGVEVDNMEITLAGVAKTRIINSVPEGTGSSFQATTRLRYDGAGVVAVRANAIGTVNARYSVTIVCTRIN